MVKHIKTIRRQKLTNCLSVFEHCMGLTLKGLTQLPQKRRNNFGKKAFSRKVRATNHATILTMYQ